jgi:isoleucyl-tRNA synthetase
VVQQARRDAGLNVSDRISLVLDTPPAVRAAVTEHRDFVAREVLAESVTFGTVGADGFPGDVGDGETVRVVVTRA